MKIAIPMTRLTRKDTPFVWSKEADKAFNKLKTAYVTPLCLRIFTPGVLMKIETNALDLALGGCASILTDDKWHLVAYYLRKFLGLEERYNVHDKELLAIVACLQH